MTKGKARTDNSQLDYTGNPRVQTVNTQPSMTIQSDGHLSDIREILKKFKATGIIDHLAQVDAQYMDVSEFTDYVDLMNHVRAAERQFMTLPAAIRAEFNHDVAEWLDAAHDAPKAEAVQQEVNATADAVESVSADESAE